MGAKYALKAVHHVQSNPDLSKQAAAAAAGFRGMGGASVFSPFGPKVTPRQSMGRTHPCPLFAPPSLRSHCNALLVAASRATSADALGLGSAGSVFKLSNYMGMLKGAEGFEATMTRSEAAKILGIRLAV